MTVTEILADNLRRLMQGKTAAEWTNQNDALTLIVDFALLPPTRSSLQDLDPIAAHAGVEPWQLLAPLCGLGKWGGHSLYRPGAHPSFPGIHVGSVRPSNVKWIADIMDRDFPELFATEEEARAAVEAALFEGGK